MNFKNVGIRQTFFAVVVLCYKRVKKKNLLEYFWAPGGSSMVDLLVVAILSYHDVILSLPSYAFMTCDHRNTFNLRY